MFAISAFFSATSRTLFFKWGGSTSRNFLNGRGVKIKTFQLIFFATSRVIFKLGGPRHAFFSRPPPASFKKKMLFFHFWGVQILSFQLFFWPPPTFFIKNGGGVHLTQFSKWERGPNSRLFCRFFWPPPTFFLNWGGPPHAIVSVFLGSLNSKLFRPPPA